MYGLLRYLMTRTWISVVCLLVAVPEAIRDVFALGYRISWVANAKEALAALARDEFAFDLVFSDIIMPGMNGVELANTIRERYPGLPVVLTSGYSNVLAETAHRGFELVQKPYSVEVLSRTLRKAIVDRKSIAG